MSSTRRNNIFEQIRVVKTTNWDRLVKAFLFFFKARTHGVLALIMLTKNQPKKAILTISLLLPILHCLKREVSLNFHTCFVLKKNEAQLTDLTFNYSIGRTHIGRVRDNL